MVTLAVSTNLSRGDIVSAVLARMTRPVALLKLWGLWTLGVAALLAFVRGMPQSAIDVLVLAISAAAGALFSVVASIGVLVLRVRRALGTGDGVLGEHHYLLTDEGLQERTAVNETLSRWNGIRGAETVGKFVFVEMPSGGFHILPRRCFDSPDHEATFLSEVRRRASTSA